jgi:glycolate oxidase FAD binding subunit
MGIRAVTGRAEVVRSGGRVLKNVTGLDLCKLFSGSHGTLGLITEATLKVLPAPEATGTVAVRGLDAKAGVAALSAALGSPFGVSGAAWLPEGAHAAGIDGPVALMRIEDFAPSVAYRTEKLAELLGLPRTEILDDASSRAVWAAVRDADPLAPEPGDAVWRVSTRPSAGPAVLAASAMRGFLDWGGGLVWLTGPATAEAHTRVERAAGAGQWTLMRAPDALRAAVRAVPDDPAPLARIGRRVKDAFDPKGILNPGRVRAGQ